VDYDDRDLRAEPPADARYIVPEAPIDKATFFRSLEKQLRDHLYRTRSTEIFTNPELRLYSRAAESRDDFIVRCRDAAGTRADEDAAKLRERVQARLDRLGKQQRTTDDRVRELTVDSQQRVQQELIAGAGQLISIFLQGGGSARSLSGAASRRGITRRTRERLDTARGKAEDVADEIRDIEQDLADDLAELQEKWEACAQEIETKAIPLEQSDVAIDEIVLLWVPVQP
jgi:hypothetical protein